MAIKKKDFSQIKAKYSKKATYKEDRFFDLGNDFTEATGIPGPSMGHINMLLGHTENGTDFSYSTMIFNISNKLLTILTNY